MFHGIKLTAFVFARAFLGLILGLSVWALLPLFVQWQPTVVMSGSMEKNIMTGDILVADPVSQEEIKSGLLNKGHVILANDPADPKTLFTHRIIRVMPDGTFMTKGDANAQVDRLTVKPENVKGIERLRIPFIGIPVREMKMGNYVPAGIFIALVAFSFILVQTDRKRDQKSTSDKTTVMTKPEMPKIKPAKATASTLLLLLVTSAVVAPAIKTEGSQAFFSGSSVSAASTFTVASTMPSLGGAGGSGAIIVETEKFAKKYSTTVDFTSSFPIPFIKSSITAGFVPVITWEPRPVNVALNANDYRPNRITNGSHDAYLNSIAQQLITAGDPRVVIRLAPGANSAETLWTEKASGNATGSYKAAWRYIVDFFRSKGLKNTDWAWTLNAPVPANDDILSIYPGSSYVDYAGLNFTAYNSAGVPSASSAEGYIGSSMNILNSVTPDKNVLVFQRDSMPINSTVTQRRWADDLNYYFHIWGQNKTVKVSGVLGLTY